MRYILKKIEETKVYRQTLLSRICNWGIKLTYTPDILRVKTRGVHKRGVSTKLVKDKEEWIHSLSTPLTRFCNLLINHPKTAKCEAMLKKVTNFLNLRGVLFFKTL